MLQIHLDGKKHAGKVRILGGPEAFQPPQPLPPLPEAEATAATPAPAKKPKAAGMRLREALLRERPFRD